MGHLRRRAGEKRLIVVLGDLDGDRSPGLPERAAQYAVQGVPEHFRIADTQHHFLACDYRHALAALEQPVDDNSAIGLC